MIYGLTPIGAVFAVIVIIIMVTSVVSVVYYSLIAPWVARRKQLRAHRAALTESSMSPASTYSPYLDKSPNGLETPEMAEEKNVYADLFVNQEDSREMYLSPPMPAYAADPRGRFSTSTQDGIWWVV